MILTELTNKIKKVIKNPYKILDRAIIKFPVLSQHLRDETCLNIFYRSRMGQRLNLENPQTLNEKIQWLKLNDRNPRYSVMADKYLAKKYIADRVGEEYIIPTLGVWNSFDEINFDNLPNQFVLKCTHDCGGVVICPDKNKLDIAETKKKIEKSFNTNFYWMGREWQYKNIKPRIIAEKYLTDESDVGLKDYKIFCFNGKAEYVEVDFNRQIEHKLNPYDFDWNPLNFCDSSKNDYSVDICKPARLNEMRRIAEELSKDMMLLRVDFYCIEDKLYIGELTLTPGCGFIKFNPKEIDLKYGKMLDMRG